MVYKATDEVKYKELVEGLINQIIEAKTVFENEYDRNSNYKDLRWRERMEGLFIDQLEVLTRRVSKGDFPEEAIGEYVMEFFVVSEDEGMFDED